MKHYRSIALATLAALTLVVAHVSAGFGNTNTMDDKTQKDGKDAKPVAAAAVAAPSDDMVVAAQRWSYPLTTCPISGEKLGPKSSTFVVQGHMVKTCCDKCKAEIVKDPAQTLEKLNKAVIDAQKAAYPLATCPISGEKLGDKSVDKVVGTRLVRVCCNDCVKEIDKDSKAALAKLDEAYVKAQKDSYPIKTCLVSGEALGGMGEPVDKVYGTTLVRFCCASCIKTFEKAPEEPMKKLADARAPKK